MKLRLAFDLFLASACISHINSDRIQDGCPFPNSGSQFFPLFCRFNFGKVFFFILPCTQTDCPSSGAIIKVSSVRVILCI